MRGLQQGGGFGGPSCQRPHSCSHPHPQTPACALLVSSGSVLTLGWVGQLEPLAAQWGQSWTRLGLEWGRGAGKSSCRWPPLPMHIGAHWVTPREPQNLGFSCLLHILPRLPSLLPARARTASDFSVLTGRGRGGVSGDPSQHGHHPRLPPGAGAGGAGMTEPRRVGGPKRVAVPRAWVCPLLEETSAPLGPTHLY